jgi:chromosome segregation ATPase
MKRIFTTLMLLALLIAPSFAVNSQTRASSTVTTDETISFLLTQNENAKSVIAAQENRIKDLESEVAVERENSASVSKSYESAKSEIVSLKQSNEALSRAVSLNEQTIALLQTDNQKQKDKAKRATRDKWKAIAVAAGAIALRFLIP